MFGTTVACMRIVSVAELIGESLNGETWLCGEVRFSLGRGIVFFGARSSERPGTIERAGAYFLAGLNFSMCRSGSSSDAQPAKYRQIISNVRFVGARPV